jgi:hypothetical protein
VKRRTLSFLAVATALLASGCLYSPVDEAWGDAQSANTEAQIADPNGAGDPDGPRGVGAVTSEEIANRYYKDQVLQPTRHGLPGVLEDVGQD